jgi:hypothetical protein
MTAASRCGASASMRSMKATLSDTSMMCGRMLGFIAPAPASP